MCCAVLAAHGSRILSLARPFYVINGGTARAVTKLAGQQRGICTARIWMDGPGDRPSADELDGRRRADRDGNDGDAAACVIVIRRRWGDMVWAKPEEARA